MSDYSVRGRAAKPTRPRTLIRSTFFTGAGPHPQRVLTLMPRLGSAHPRLGMAAGPSRRPTLLPDPPDLPGLRSQRRKGREHPVVVGLVAGVLQHFAMAHDAVLVDHEHRPLRDTLEADHVFVEHAVVADRLL